MYPYFNNFMNFNFGIDQGYRTYMPATINDLKILQDALIRNMNTLIDDFNSNADYVNDGKEAINNLIEENKKLLTEITELEKQIKDSWTEPQELIAQIKAMQEKIDLFETNNQQIMKSVADMKADIEKSTLINENIQTQFTRMEDIVNDLNNNYHDVNSNIGEFNANYENIKKQLDELDSTKEDYLKIAMDINNLTAKLNTANENYINFNTVYQQAIKQLEETQKQYDDIQKALENAPSPEDIQKFSDKMDETQRAMNDATYIVGDAKADANRSKGQAYDYSVSAGQSYEKTQALYDELTKGDYNQDLTQLQNDVKIFTTIFPNLQDLFTQVNGSIYDDTGTKTVQTNDNNIVSELALLNQTQQNMIIVASGVQKDLTAFHKKYTTDMQDMNSKLATKVDNSKLADIETEISGIQKVSNEAKEISDVAHDLAIDLQTKQNTQIIPDIATNKTNIENNAKTIDYNIKHRQTIENYWHLPLASEFYLSTDGRCKVGMLRTRNGHYEILAHLVSNETIEISGDFTSTTPIKPLQNNGNENIPILENSIPYDRNQKYIFYVTEHITNSDNSITTFIRKFTFITPQNDRNNIVDNTYSSPAVMYYENII